MSGKRLLILLTPLAVGCSWFTDFRDQPKIKPWEAQYAGNDTTPFRGQPEFSVPITGDPVPAYVVSHSNAIATIDSFSALPNPHAPTRAALENGRRYYQINCSVCHGHAGGGDGMAVRYGVPAPMLLTDMTKKRTDGYIWGIIRNGRNLMPNYDRIEDADRWDVVLYVRALQGLLPGVTPDTTPPGKPGETGRTLPGYTRTAPTRPVPWRPQDMTRPDSGPPPASAAPTTPAPRSSP